MTHAPTFRPTAYYSGQESQSTANGMNQGTPLLSRRGHTSGREGSTYVTRKWSYPWRQKKRAEQARYHRPYRPGPSSTYGTHQVDNKSHNLTGAEGNAMPSSLFCSVHTAVQYKCKKKQRRAFSVKQIFFTDSSYVEASEMCTTTD